MKEHVNERSERGQAMAETAVFSLMAVLLAYGLLTLIPVHRTRTVATSAAYACTQFISQAHDPGKAAAQAEEVGRRTLEASWSATSGAGYELTAWANGANGERGCSVAYRTPLLFNGLIGLDPPGWRKVEFSTLAEAWKADWP